MGPQNLEPNVLVIDDDPAIRGMVRDLLMRNHLRANAVGSTAEAERALESTRIDLVILDVLMPGEDGTTFCRRLRERSSVPILMLSALGEDVDRIVGLELGADDYLAKPFNPRELVARAKSLLRRAPPILPGESRQVQTVYRFGPFNLFPEARRLVADGEDIELTSGEFSLLLLLVQRAPRVLTRDQILGLLKGAAVNPFDRSIDTQISRIRRKLEVDPGRPHLIKTVRNLGYAFAAKVEEVRD
jgi:two-component system OmpR family response regulator